MLDQFILHNSDFYENFSVVCLSVHLYMIFMSPLLNGVRMAVSNRFARTARLWNSLPTACCPLFYELNGFKSQFCYLY